MNPASRITELRNQLKLSQQEFAEQIGITQGALSQLENKKSALSLSTIVSISKAFGIDCNWLIIGDSEKLFRENLPSNIAPISPSHSQDKAKNSSLTPLVDEEAHAGYIQQCDDIDFINTLNVYRIPGFENGNYRMFEVKGDSMMPTIHPREILVTEKVDDHQLTENGTLAVIITDDGIVAKRYYRYQEASENCILKSDNPDYETYTIHSKDVKEIWQIKARITNVFNTDAPANHERLQSIESDLLELKHKMEKMDKQN